MLLLSTLYVYSYQVLNWKETPPPYLFSSIAQTDTRKNYVYIEDFVLNLLNCTKKPYKGFTPTHNLPLFVCSNALSLNL